MIWTPNRWKPIHEWHRIFVWIPKRLPGDKMVWLETIERRIVLGRWEYRKIQRDSKSVRCDCLASDCFACFPVKRACLAILFLLVVTGVAAGDKKTDLKPTFRYEGQTYVIDSIKAHVNGSMDVEFSPSQKGGWYITKPEPELGRKIYHTAEPGIRHAVR